MCFPLTWLDWCFFPFSINDKGKIWFYSLPKETIVTWVEMAASLLAKYLPLAKVSKLRSDIMTFTQRDDESILWKRYKVLLNKASNHGLPSWLEIQFFYNRLYPNTKMIIDAAAGGALMNKNLEEARELRDEMSTNHYQWQSTRGPARKIAREHEIDTLSAIQAQLAVIVGTYFDDDILWRISFGALSHDYIKSSTWSRLPKESWYDVVCNCEIACQKPWCTHTYLRLIVDL